MGPMKRSLGSLWIRPGLLIALGCLLACQPGEEAAEPPNPPKAVDYAAIEARLEPREARGKTSDAFPNIRMTDQHGREYRFFDDLIKDRSVVVNFMFTDCALICPGTTSHLARPCSCPCTLSICSAGRARRGATSSRSAVY